jgi:hypothetical protein
MTDSLADFFENGRRDIGHFLENGNENANIEQMSDVMKSLNCTHMPSQLSLNLSEILPFVPLHHVNQMESHSGGINLISLVPHHIHDSIERIRNKQHSS